MSIATILLWIIALILLVVGWSRKDGSLLRGVNEGFKTLKRSALLLILAFIIVGYITVLAPQNLVETWIGPKSGLGGLLLADILGALLPGGPYVVFPLIAALYQTGAGMGPAVTLITSWAMLALISVSFELTFMGWRFSAIRWGLGLIFPVLAGLLVILLFR